AAGATLGGTTSVSAVSGVASFSGLSIDKSGANYQLTASSGMLTSADSAAFDVGLGVVLNLAVSDSPDPVQAGSQVTYTLTFSNSSSANVSALGVTLTDTLPANTTFVSASDGGTESGGVVTWSLGDLTPGASGTRTLVVDVASPLADGTQLTNSATLQDTGGDSATASQTTTVQSAAILSLSISDSPDPVQAGSQITYTLSFSNSSSANETALGVTLTDTLPSNATFVSASDGGAESGGLVTWSLGDLTPGASGSKTLVVQVGSPLQNGTQLSNSATLQNTGGDSATASQTTTVQSAAILSLSISDSPDPVQAGSQITYTLSFSNSSSANETALGVTLTDTLPSNATFVSASDGGAESGGLVTWSLGDLTPGASGSRTLVVQAGSPLPDGTQLTNSVTLKDTQGDSSTAGQTTTVQSAPLWSLSQSHDPDPVLPGEELTITISFGNTSSANETALGVTLTVTVPAKTTFVSASDDSTVDSNGTLINWSLGDMTPGASGSRTLVVEVDLSLPNGTLLTSNATIQDAQGDGTTNSISSTVGSTGGVAVVPSTIITSPTVSSAPPQQSLAPLAEAELGQGLARQDVVTLGQQEVVVQEGSPLLSPTPFTPEAQLQKAEEQKADTSESLTGRCAGILSLSGTDSPDPAMVGSRVNYTLIFTNSSVNETARGVFLKNTLPREMSFVSASDEGTEAGGVITWDLGDIAPGASGSRSVVVQVGSSVTSGALLINNKAFLEDNKGRCAWTTEVTTVRPLSIGDDDDDGFPNQDEIACGSDPLDPASTCYNLYVPEMVESVRRGSKVTFEALVQSNFSFEGPVAFSTPDGMPGVTWSFSNPSAVLSGSQRSASVSFTVQTTSSTPLGLHEITMKATSGSMRSDTVFTLEVLP
ncbi:MAG: hypothetical protein ACE5JQ_12595, partial [Candidatus Methylomirabilales bacterium]